jgi:fermentation-respiration switch protein FrsA (DUF1100 family)
LARIAARFDHLMAFDPMSKLIRKFLPRSPIMNFLISVALGVALLYVTATALLYSFQRRLIYFPDPQYSTPADAELNGVREVRLDAPDGARIVAWWAPARAGQPTLLYFHGNASTLDSRSDRIQLFTRVGLGIFMPAYRGYSGSTGSPSEPALIADAMLAYEHLRKSGLAALDIVPYGESLGSGVAVQVAAAKEVGAVVLDAPYTSLPDVGKWRFPVIPVHTLMIDRFESKRYIAGVKAPILIMHGAKDEVIPIGFGKELFALAPEPKAMEVFQGAGHSDIYMFGALGTLQRFLRAYRRKAEVEMPAIDRL